MSENNIKQQYLNKDGLVYHTSKMFEYIGKKISDSIPESLPANGGNAATVGGYTVKSNVPSNAKFTDTTYTLSVNDNTCKLELVDGTGTVANSIDFPKYTLSIEDDGRITLCDSRNGKNYNLNKNANLKTLFPVLNTLATKEEIDVLHEFTNLSDLRNLTVTSEMLNRIYGLSHPVASMLNSLYDKAMYNISVQASDINMLEGVSGNIQEQINALKESTSTDGNVTYELSINPNGDRFALFDSNGNISTEKGGWYTLDDLAYAGRRINTKNSEIFNDYTNNVSTGDYSHAEGKGTSATGAYTHAEGLNNHAKGDASHAEGESTIARTVGSHAEGKSTEAGEDGGQSYAHAEGVGSRAFGRGSHAEGESTLAEAKFSHAEGGACQATGDYSHAEGCNDQNDHNVVASGKAAHAEGCGTTASGDGSHAEGNSTIASAPYAHAEGYETQAINGNTHAEGFKTVAAGLRSHAEGIQSQTGADATAAHAEGWSSIANGVGSHAEGVETIANGNYSHTEGGNTISTAQYQHVEGKYNIEDTEKKYAHIVGNGTSENRSNAHTVDWDGNAWYAGNVTVGEDKKELATTDVVTHTSNGLMNSSDKIKLDSCLTAEFVDELPTNINNTTFYIVG